MYVIRGNSHSTMCRIRDGLMRERGEEVRSDVVVGEVVGRAESPGERSGRSEEGDDVCSHVVERMWGCGARRGAAGSWAAAGPTTGSPLIRVSGDGASAMASIRQGSTRRPSTRLARILAAHGASEASKTAPFARECNILGCRASGHMILACAGGLVSPSSFAGQPEEGSTSPGAGIRHTTR